MMNVEARIIPTWRLRFSILETHMVACDQVNAISKIYHVIGSTWQCLGVVRREFHGGHIHQMSELMQWPPGASGCAFTISVAIYDGC
jgi:hypothetical protein